MTAERVQKILSRAGVASRRKAEELIAAGRVTVNGEVVGLGAKAVPGEDAIKVDGKLVRLPASHTYVLLHKPAGYVTTLSDPEGRRTVIDLVPPKLRRGIVPVGRLDYNTEGLLLLTDDGELAHRVMHPRYRCTKVYEVKVKGVPEERDLEKLRRGVVLEGRRTAPARIEPRRQTKGPRAGGGNTWLELELTEGRTRQVREMFFRIGHPVQRLRRRRIGPVSDRGLPVGACRELSEREVAALRRATGLEAAASAGGHRRRAGGGAKRRGRGG